MNFRSSPGTLISTPHSMPALTCCRLTCDTVVGDTDLHLVLSARNGVGPLAVKGVSAIRYPRIWQPRQTSIPSL
jgi:hypothetical protein